MQGALRSLKKVYISTIMAFLEKVFTATSNSGIAERSRKFSGKKGPMAFHRYLVAAAAAAVHRLEAAAADQLLRSQLANLNCSIAAAAATRRPGWQETDCCWPQLLGRLSSRQLAD